ncbi:Phosphotransferase enzyme family protein [Seinonella peptonophila]|uniref:Phosphotransferase enzyme family protein n=1 Tax=Seinonella peptonophila TaxID=112248 RepID=A0A1M4YR85_9BACL|nr:aminoglycoside phosphotransferase family protein [Seinonella peptonophila]SHF08305.1 Phosphotransferase enzyme family protein [Seinonella peptonophila]
MLEPKPNWSDIPRCVSREMESILGSVVKKTEIVYGGFGPSATFRLYLQDGRTIFVKGAGKGSTSVNWKGVKKEEILYQEVKAVQAFSPAYIGSVKQSDWHLLLLEDMGHAVEVPPWTEALARNAMEGVAQFHLLGLQEKAKLEKMDVATFAFQWRMLKETKAERELLFALFPGKRDEIITWFDHVIDHLIEAEERVFDINQPWGLIHCDLRSDNLRFLEQKLILFDWATTCMGPLMLDIAFFLPSIWGQSGPFPSILLTEYTGIMQNNGVVFSQSSIEAAAAFTAGFFAARAGKEPIDFLPRLRAIQYMQLGPALHWVADALGLPAPPSLPPLERNGLDADKSLN